MAGMDREIGGSMKRKVRTVRTKGSRVKKFGDRRATRKGSGMINIDDIELTADEEEIAKIEKLFRAVEAQFRKMLNGMKKDPAEVTGFLQVLLDMLNDMWAARCADQAQWLKELQRELKAIPREGEKPN
jgi:hypothetical protein